MKKTIIRTNKQLGMMMGALALASLLLLNGATQAHDTKKTTARKTATARRSKARVKTPKPVVARTVQATPAPVTVVAFPANGAELLVRLNSALNVKTAQAGDTFTATVVSPEVWRDAVVTGHVASLKRAGKLMGRTELALEFDAIKLTDGRSATYHAQVEQVQDDEVKQVDGEGNVKAKDKTKDTAIRSGGGAAVGAVIGGIAGGGKGAAIGAILGGAAGAGSVFVFDRNDMVLEQGTALKVRTVSAVREAAAK